ncbi:MAG: hypothetical protein KDI88_02785 [Gammaproteobacteria bacterium]|nr:hypothetical protein [Gammaproteobacteria bacterium]
MTLNDPFGRNARRQERRYAQFRRQLLAQGCRTDEALDAFGRRVDSMAAGIVAALASACLLTWWLLPAAVAVVMILAAVALVWLASSYLQTRSLLNRLRLEPRQESPTAGAGTSRQTPPPEDSV